MGIGQSCQQFVWVGDRRGWSTPDCAPFLGRRRIDIYGSSSLDRTLLMPVAPPLTTSLPFSSHQPPTVHFQPLPAPYMVEGGERSTPEQITPHTPAPKTPQPPMPPCSWLHHWSSLPPLPPEMEVMKSVFNMIKMCNQMFLKEDVVLDELLPLPASGSWPLCSYSDL